MPRWRGCMPASPARICPASRKTSERTRGQPMPRFAANLSMMFNEVPFLDRFDAAAKAGFTAVEFLFPYDHPAEAVGERLRRNGLTQALFNLPPGNWDAGEKGFAALPHGFDVVIEPINPRNVPGYFLDDFAFARDLIVELKIPNLKLQFDIYHCQSIHGHVTMHLREMMPIVSHTQVASSPSRNEPDGEELNYPFLFGELDRLGYSGFVGCEYNPRGRTTDGLGWFKPYAGVKP